MNKTDSGNTQSQNTSVAMLLCRSEDIKGIPEICLGVYAESLCDINCCFQRIDIRYASNVCMYVCNVLNDIYIYIL